MDNQSGANFASGATCTALSFPFPSARRQPQTLHYQDFRGQNSYTGEEFFVQSLGFADLYGAFGEPGIAIKEKSQMASTKTYFFTSENWTRKSREEMANNSRLYGSFCTELDFTNSVDSFDDVTPSPRSTLSSSEYEQGIESNRFLKFTSLSKPAQPLKDPSPGSIPFQPLYQPVFDAAHNVNPNKKNEHNAHKYPCGATAKLPLNSTGDGTNCTLLTSTKSRVSQNSHRDVELEPKQGVHVAHSINDFPQSLTSADSKSNANPTSTKKRSYKDSDEAGEEQVEPPKKKARTSTRDTSQPPKSSQITLSHIKPYFELPIREAAARLGLCTTLLKQLCRRVGVKRWPQRKLSALDRKIQGFEAKLRRVTKEAERQKLEEEIAKAREEKSFVIANAATPFSDNNPDRYSGTDALDVERDAVDHRTSMISETIDFALNSGNHFIPTFFGFDEGHNDDTMSAFFEMV